VNAIIDMLLITTNILIDYCSALKIEQAIKLPQTFHTKMLCIVTESNKNVSGFTGQQQ